jgi:RNA polymerase sigma-70 factor (ECF subfamily)
MRDEDKILVSKVIQDDKVAFQQLFNKYAERIYYFSMRYVKNREEAEEIAQEVFVRVWLRRFDLKEDLSFSSYIFMIAKNALIDLIRKKQKETDFYKNNPPSMDMYTAPSDDSMEYNELAAIIDRSIDDLPQKRKQIYLLSRDEGLTYKQISEKLNISIKTVETHMRLALQQLKSSVRNNYELTITALLFIDFLFF